MADPADFDRSRRRHSLSLHDVDSATVPLLQLGNAHINVGRTRGEEVPRPGSEEYDSYALRRKLALETAANERLREMLSSIVTRYTASRTWANCWIL